MAARLRTSSWAVNTVESAMTQHLQEISESVQLIRQENSGWFSED
ncbi:GntR family transcriptional regulator [Salmonella enterica subsp. enterica serovar Enteritidis]|nr:GntR family transcriptional regulator [Salmonella enterica subsp. enterica serovar Enteritidis]